MKATAVEADPAPWLALLPDGVGDELYRADVRAEAVERARHGRVEAAVRAAQAALAAGLAGGGDPLTLRGVAGELAELRTLGDALPVVRPVQPERHRRVVEGLALPVPAVYRLPSPPRLAVELAHHNRSHAASGELPPVPFDADLLAVQAYQAVSAEVARLWRLLAHLREPWTGRSPIGDRVRAWHATVTDAAWEKLAGRIVELRQTVASADQARGEAVSHRCKFGDIAGLRLQVPPVGEPWDFRLAVRDDPITRVSG